MSGSGQGVLISGSYGERLPSSFSELSPLEIGETSFVFLSCRMNRAMHREENALRHEARVVSAKPCDFHLRNMPFWGLFGSYRTGPIGSMACHDILIQTLETYHNKCH